jgi:hypothetical protein
VRNASAKLVRAYENGPPHPESRASLERIETFSGQSLQGMTTHRVFDRRLSCVTPPFGRVLDHYTHRTEDNRSSAEVKTDCAWVVRMRSILVLVLSRAEFSRQERAIPQR